MISAARGSWWPVLTCIGAAVLCTSLWAQEEHKGTVTGFVRDAHGQPIAGATVRLLQEGETGSKATTDREGKYTLENLLAGKYTFEAGKKGYLPNKRAGIAVTEGKETTLNFGLLDAGEPGAIKCVVLDPDGRAAVGAKAVIRKGPGRVGDSFKVDSRGYMVIDQLPAGVYEIEFLKPGVGAKIEKDVKIEAAQVVTGQVKLDPNLAPPTTGTLKLELTLPGGKPAVAARVFVFQPGTKNRFSGKSDENGVATFGDLEEGEYAFQARAKGYKRIFQKGIKVAAAETKRLELQFQPAR